MTIAAENSVFVHPAALCESDRIGADTRIWAFAHVMDGAVIGRECNICDHVFVERGARIGNRVTVKNGVTVFDGVVIDDDVFCGPGMIFTNDRYPRSARMPEVAHRYSRPENWLLHTKVRRGATIGAGAIILCGVTLGCYASVAAGAIVTADVPDHGLVVGQPARLTGWVCFCGLPLDDDLACPSCPRAYRRHGDTLEMVS